MWINGIARINHLMIGYTYIPIVSPLPGGSAMWKILSIVLALWIGVPALLMLVSYYRFNRALERRAT